MVTISTLATLLAASVVSARVLSPRYGNGTSQPTTLISASSASGVLEATATPIANPINTNNPSNFVPDSGVSLFYGDKSQAVPPLNVSLTMKSPTVVLENIASIQSVTCGNSHINITFLTAAAFELALQQWVKDESISLVTNHLGNCDAETTRGFFTATEFRSDVASKSIVAAIEEQDITGVAESTSISFGGSSSSLVERTIIAHPEFSWDTTASLPSGTVLVNDGALLNVVAEEAYFTPNLNISGQIGFNFLTWKLDVMTFDLTVSAQTALILQATSTAAIDKSSTYSLTPVSKALINIPGIISITPTLNFSLGSTFILNETAVSHVSVSAALPTFTVHLDGINSENSYSSGMAPTTTATATVDGNLAADVSASLSSKFWLDVELLGIISTGAGVSFSAAFDEQVHFSTGNYTKGSSCSGRWTEGSSSLELDGLLGKAQTKEPIYSKASPATVTCL